MSDASVVADENNILLFRRQQVIIRLCVLAIRSKEVVPQWHEECVVGVKVEVVAKVVLRSVEQVAEWRVLVCKAPMLYANIGMPPRVDCIKENQVCTNDCPMLVTTREIRKKKGWTKCSNVDEVFLKVLNERRRRVWVNGQVMETMHGLHLTRNMKPAVGEIVQGLDKENVAHQGLDGASPNSGGVGEKHGWKDQLERHLNPHVKDAPHQVVIFFSHQLLLSHLMIVIVLIDKEVMQRQRQMRARNTQKTNDVEWNNGSQFEEERRHQKQPKIIVRVARMRRMRRGHNLALGRDRCYRRHGLDFLLITHRQTMAMVGYNLKKMRHLVRVRTYVMLCT